MGGSDPRDDDRARIERIMAAFDFAKVASRMRSRQWEWHTDGGKRCPDVDELHRVAFHLLWRSASTTAIQRRPAAFSSSGSGSNSGWRSAEVGSSRRT